jgi:hypothetical protein
MRTFIGVILPLLVILLMTPVASAQDVPALVLIDVNVHFTTPQASVTFSGQQEWRNGFGYADSATRGFTNRWTVTGSECGPNCAWLEPYYQNVAPGAPPRTDFRLDVEAGSVNGQFHFFIGFPGLWGDVVLPGDYAASGTYIDQVKFPMIGGSLRRTEAISLWWRPLSRRSCAD